MTQQPLDLSLHPLRLLHQLPILTLLTPLPIRTLVSVLVFGEVVVVDVAAAVEGAMVGDGGVPECTTAHHHHHQTTLVPLISGP